ncbi:MAG: hypothetical protein J6Z01_03245 [Bacteroidales bacterium]|nr:hypothetical protein [Bacteroidales bacterium]
MKALRTLIILFLMCCCLPASSQETRIITGSATILNDLPVSGITVTAKKSLAATMTDSLGRFTIACKPKDRLLFKAKAFDATRRRICRSTSDTITVKLNFIASENNVDMAIGYGYLSSSKKTQAIEYVERGNNYCNYIDIYELIKAKFNGIQVTSNGCIIVRGPNSVYGSNCATYVVDGNKVDAIDYISTCDIKEISLLKDGTAAIYGCQGANGVFLINLKDGKE